MIRGCLIGLVVLVLIYAVVGSLVQVTTGSIWAGFVGGAFAVVAYLAFWRWKWLGRFARPGGAESVDVRQTRPPRRGNDVEAYFREQHDPAVVELFTQWRRNRAFFDETEGFGQRRDHELMLRGETEQARERLEAADRQWEQEGFPHRGRTARAWKKARLDFLKAVDAENQEYRGVLLFREIDPDDDEAIAEVLDIWRSDVD